MRSASRDARVAEGKSPVREILTIGRDRNFEPPMNSNQLPLAVQECLAGTIKNKSTIAYARERVARRLPRESRAEGRQRSSL